MTIPTLLLWLLTSVALLASIFAASVALRTSDRSLSRRLSALSTAFESQAATLDELSAQLKALRQRENMRAYRDRRAGKSAESEDAPRNGAESPEEWRRRMNREIALGRLKP